MTFKDVKIYESSKHPLMPLLKYRDPEVLYIWFEPGLNAWILTQWGWQLWPTGWSIAQVMLSAY